MPRCQTQVVVDQLYFLLLFLIDIHLLINRALNNNILTFNLIDLIILNLIDFTILVPLPRCQSQIVIYSLDFPLLLLINILLLINSSFNYLFLTLNLRNIIALNLVDFSILAPLARCKTKVVVDRLDFPLLLFV